MKYFIDDNGADITFGKNKEIIIFFTKDTITEREYIGNYNFNINYLSNKQLIELEEFIYNSIKVKTDNIKGWIIDNFDNLNEMLICKSKFNF